MQDFQWNPRLAQLLQAPENMATVEQGRVNVLNNMQAYRNTLQTKALEQEAILSSGFWYFIYQDLR